MFNLNKTNRNAITSIGVLFFIIVALMMFQDKSMYQARPIKAFFPFFLLITSLIIITKVIIVFMFKLLSRTGVFSKSGRIVIGQYHV